MADGYAAAQNWAIALALAGAIAWYYSSTAKKAPSKPASRSAPAKDGKPEAKKPAAKKPAKKSPGGAEKAVSAPQALVGRGAKEEEPQAAQDGNKKRKASSDAPTPAPSAPSPSRADDDEIDMSTRQFAESMRKAQQGTDLKKAGQAEHRVKTVKPKNNHAAPAWAPGSPSSSDADDESWSKVAPPAIASGGVDDMLEPAAPGPSHLRITAPTAPAKEKAHKPPKGPDAESKKQRQNRQKKDAEKAARAEAEAERKRLMEQQRKTAREARGEPARNGVSVPPAPATNPWAEHGAAPDAPAVSSRPPAPLLDTFEVESSSSSTAEISTAATSTTDSAPAHWRDAVGSGEDDLTRALEESRHESGWSQVTIKKAKNKAAPNRGSTPVPQHPVTASPAAQPPPPSQKAAGFGALEDEYVEPSHWHA